MLIDLLRFEGDSGGGSGTSSSGGTGGEGSGTTTPPEPQEGTPDPQDGLGEGDDRVKRANAEAAKYRRELRAAQERLEQLENAGKSELEKKDAAVTKAQERVSGLERRTRQLSVRVLASQAGIVSDEAAIDAARLLDWDSIE